MSDKSRGTFQILAIGFFLFFLVGVLGSMVFFGWKFLTLRNQTDGKAAAPKTEKSIPKYVRIQREYTDADFLYRLSIDSIKADSVHAQDSVCKIEILSKISRKKIQEIIPGPNPELSDLDQRFYKRFVMEDMNFDGQNDIRLISWLGMRKQQVSYCWLYNLQSRKFELDTNLSKLFDLQFDAKTKTVFSYERSGCCYDHVMQLFTWENGQLVLQKYELVMNIPTRENANAASVTVSNRVNGVLVEKSFDFDSIPDQYLQYDPNWPKHW